MLGNDNQVLDINYAITEQRLTDVIYRKGLINLKLASLFQYWAISLITATNL
jgi:hypothetical protein